MSDVTAAIDHWISQQVIGQQLCPFARLPWTSGRVRTVVNDSRDETTLVRAFLQELLRLYETPRSQIETTLLVLADALPVFDDFLDLVGLADHLIDEAGLRGTVQLAYFHPAFIFADAAADDPANAVGQAPYPILHLLREDSVSEARATYPNIEEIPLRNAALLRRLHGEEE